MNLAVLAEQNVERFGSYGAVHWNGEWLTNEDQLADAKRFANGHLARPPARRSGGGDAAELPRGAVHQRGHDRHGGVVVPVVFLLAPGEINHILADCRPRVPVTSPLFLDKAMEAMEGTRGPAAAPARGRPRAGGCGPFAVLMRAASPRFEIVDREPGDVALIMHTGGPPGDPRA